MRKYDPSLFLPALAALTVCLIAAISQAGERSSSYLAAMESIRSAELQAHVEYLADDELEGREAGRRGGRAAGDYLRARLQELGLTSSPQALGHSSGPGMMGHVFQ